MEGKRDLGSVSSLVRRFMEMEDDSNVIEMSREN